MSKNSKNFKIVLEDVTAKTKRRSYQLSKFGCTNCKRRFKKKCDERLPACLRCVNLGVRCSYLDEDPERIQQMLRAQAARRGEISVVTGTYEQQTNTFSRLRSSSHLSLDYKDFLILPLESAEQGEFTFPVYKYTSIHMNLNDYVQQTMASYNYVLFDHTSRHMATYTLLCKLLVPGIYTAGETSPPVFSALTDWGALYLLCVTEAYGIQRPRAIIRRLEIAQMQAKDSVLKTMNTGIDILESYKCTGSPKSFMAAAEKYTSADLERIYQISLDLLLVFFTVHHLAVYSGNFDQILLFFGGMFSLLCLVQKVYLRFLSLLVRKPYEPCCTLTQQALMSIYLPNYNVECLPEFLDNYISFYTNFIEGTSNETTNIRCQYVSVVAFMKRIISYGHTRDRSKLCQYPTGVLYDIALSWHKIVPGEAIIQSETTSLFTYEQATFHAYYRMFGQFLRNAFPDAFYVLGTLLEGCLGQQGFNTDFALTQRGHPAEGHLFYLLRVLWFFSVRVNSYAIGVVVKDRPLPDTSANQKCACIEEQLTTFRNPFRPANFISPHPDRSINAAAHAHLELRPSALNFFEGCPPINNPFFFLLPGDYNPRINSRFHMNPNPIYVDDFGIRIDNERLYKTYYFDRMRVIENEGEFD